MIGATFGKLTVIEELPSRQVGKRKKRFVRCRCSCGTTKDMQLGNLTSGNSKSCGCALGGRRYVKPSGHANARCVYTNYRRGALARGLSFDLSFEEFFTISQQTCRYCGSEPSQILEARHSRGEKKGQPRCNGSFTYNGIDRVNNALGYSVANCVACCGSCNFMKSDMDLATFIQRVETIFHHTRGGIYR